MSQNDKHSTSWGITITDSSPKTSQGPLPPLLRRPLLPAVDSPTHLRISPRILSPPLKGWPLDSYNNTKLGVLDDLTEYPSMNAQGLKPSEST
jgi:hypothetical protein